MSSIPVVVYYEFPCAGIFLGVCHGGQDLTRREDLLGVLAWYLLSKMNCAVGGVPVVIDVRVVGFRAESVIR